MNETPGNRAKENPKHRQPRLPFPAPKETKSEKCQRILGGNLDHRTKPAAELGFDYKAATEIARHHELATHT